MVRPRTPWTETGPLKGLVARALYAATRVSTPLAVASTILALVLVAAIDRMLGARWSLGLFYYLPVAFAAWRLGRDFALASGSLAALVALTLNVGGQSTAGGIATHMWGFVTELFSYAILAIIVSEVRELFERERRLARHCHLTGALSGRAFRDVLDQTVTAAARASASIALLYADMDDFKRVNDARGHAAGDAALEAFARGVRKELGPKDQFARTGGDEFVVLLSGHNGNERERIEEIRRAAGEALSCLDIPVSASLGAIIVPAGHSLDAGDLVRRADKAMYEAKRAGRGGICIFEIGRATELSVAA